MALQKNAGNWLKQRLDPETEAWLLSAYIGSGALSRLLAGAPEWPKLHIVFREPDGPIDDRTLCIRDLAQCDGTI